MDFQQLLKQFGGGGSDEDPKAFADQLQKLTGNGDFNPFALFSGEARFHSLFLGPFTPSIARGREQFLKDGTGPITAIVETFKRQGMAAPEAAQAVRGMFESAVGMCVVAMADEQGIDSIPQLFFGHLEDPFIEHAVKLCGEKFPEPDRVRAALKELRDKAQRGGNGPLLYAGRKDQPRAYWLDLARRLIAGMDEGIAPQAVERQRDLAWWIAGALAAFADAASTVDAEYAGAAARLFIACGETAQAQAWLARYLEAEDAEDEHACRLLHQFADAAVAAGQPDGAATWLAPRVPRLLERWGRVYDLVVPLFKLQAAAQASAADLDRTVDLMASTNRKAVRQDLTREPLWRVTLADPGELLDTTQAAEYLGRSPAFIAKRLEQGTIPTWRKDDQVRIPRRALEAWKAVMDKHKLLD